MNYLQKRENQLLNMLRELDSPTPYWLDPDKGEPELSREEILEELKEVQEAMT